MSVHGGPRLSIVFALGAAALFGISAPAGKALLAVTDPWLLAGLLYLGSGVSLGAFRLVQRARLGGGAGEAALGRSDWPWLSAAILTGGIVAPAEEAAVRAEVKAALGGVVDPATGQPLGVRVFDLHEPRPGESPSRGGTAAGDLFIEVSAPGMAVSASTSGEVVGPANPEGAHYQDPESRPLLAALAIAGPGIPAGADLGVVRQIDIAPTVAGLMGIGALRDAEGKAFLQRMAPTK